jgi:hypothetical protein
MWFGRALLMGSALCAFSLGLTACDGGGGGSDGGFGENGPARAGTRCDTAEAVSLAGGKLTLSGSNANASDEYGGAINCRSGSTTVDGPQYYYKLDLKQDTIYKLALQTQVPQARVLLFDTCGAQEINLACGSGGEKGGLFGPFTQGRTYFFQVPRSGQWYLAVDSLSSQTSGGDFELTLETAQAPANRSCSAAEALSLDASGKVTVKGSTEAALNEFLGDVDCGMQSGAFVGPQVYYTLAMKQALVYSIVLKPEGSASLRFYVFSGRDCVASSIDSDCSSEGKTGMVGSAGVDGVVGLFRPAADGTYTIAVDATSAGSSGGFELSVEEVVPPANASCAAAEAVALPVGQTVTVKGTTFAALNEFGDAISCGGASAADGPQVYYQPAFVAGTTYEIEVKPSFSGARFYAFSSGCDAAKIDADCSSGGERGMVETISSQGEKVYLTPSGATPWIVAVDSGQASAAGEFELVFKEFPLPANGRCATAQELTISSGQATTVKGDTTAVPNEFGTAINCGKGSSGVVEGSQLYYKVALTAATTYAIEVAPKFTGGRLILFAASCDAASINTDCASAGATGLVSSFLSTSQPNTFEFTPSQSGDYHLLIDSTTTNGFGEFTLTIGEK